MPDRRRRNRLTRRLAVFGPAAIVVLSGVFSYAALRRELGVRERVLHTRDVMDASSQLMLSLLAAETGQRGYLLTHDSAFLVPYGGAPDRARISPFGPAMNPSNEHAAPYKTSRMAPSGTGR